MTFSTAVKSCLHYQTPFEYPHSVVRCVLCCQYSDEVTPRSGVDWCPIAREIDGFLSNNQKMRGREAVKFQDIFVFGSIRIVVCSVKAPYTLISKDFWSISIWHRSDTKVSDRCLIDVDSRVFAIWNSTLAQRVHHLVTSLEFGNPAEYNQIVVSVFR